MNWPCKLLPVMGTDFNTLSVSENDRRYKHTSVFHGIISASTRLNGVSKTFVIDRRWGYGSCSGWEESNTFPQHTHHEVNAVYGIYCQPRVPWYQDSWGQHGAHLGLAGPKWAPCWPMTCYLVIIKPTLSSGHWRQHRLSSRQLVEPTVTTKLASRWLCFYGNLLCPP